MLRDYRLRGTVFAALEARHAGYEEWLRSHDWEPEWDLAEEPSSATEEPDTDECYDYDEEADAEYDGEDREED
jgi:hypothetical protein